ncbi:MAG TPA: hypothetical protein VKC60_07590 [Opitutaceae bacterium]|nr:hypothetical protein [Opitutaceae bacterium]
MKPILLVSFLCVFASALRADGTVQVVMRDPKGGLVSDAVAWLTLIGSSPSVYTPPSEPVSVGQQGEEFQPYVTPVVVNTRVFFPNRDSVQHQVYSLSKAKRFEIPLYRGESEAIIFDQPGVVTLGCNIHDWMVAYIVVLGSPYFGKSGSNGAATIVHLPAGHYRLEVWHPRLAGQIEREVVITESENTAQVISLTLKPDRRIRRAPDAGGGGYK